MKRVIFLAAAFIALAMTPHSAHDVSAAGAVHPNSLRVTFTGFTDTTPFPFTSPSVAPRLLLDGCTYTWLGKSNKQISVYAKADGSAIMLLFGNGRASFAKYVASGSIDGPLTWTLELNQMDGITMPPTVTTSP